MTDYTLYYWPIQFRGQIVRAVLAASGADWDEAGMQPTADLRAALPAEQPVPHMGPPVLADHAAGTTLSQMPAILGYLGRRHGLMPGDPGLAAMSDKIVADANDVLYEMTLYNGAQMWTAAAWADYRPRLARWMTLFEETGRRHGLSAEGGTLLGTGAPGIADLTAATLWGVMTDRFPALRPMLDATTPALAALCDRVRARPDQADLQRWSDARFGDAWCGGQIEASLRTVLEAAGTSDDTPQAG
ncbi:glutathione S-transferase family protein [Pseudooceanicola sp. LIPI14-2-Ac024]|uniref:glutathione S-transferase family protein n=1 Tax=Pseudooceanicola sp. LIPI14-2-Ac024 TaxID=3344875 RepID=UPI0035D002A1